MGKRMNLNWKAVRAEHVSKACDIVAAERSIAASGIVIWYHQQSLPAKQVLRVAYRLANDLPDDHEVRFSSGEPTIRMLTALGFRVERIVSLSKSDHGAS
jgi:hypothetical protein